MVDLGSIGTFVSTNLVNQLHLKTTECEATTFRAADGGIMLCDQKVPKLQWFIQGHTFTSEAKVLPLKCYDLILGEDWLEDCSPMWVDYKLKMRISCAGHIIELQGVQSDTNSCRPISVDKLRGLIKHGGVSHGVQMLAPSQEIIATTAIDPELPQDKRSIPEGITQLLEKYEHLFA